VYRRESGLEDYRFIDHLYHWPSLVWRTCQWCESIIMRTWPNQSAAANRRPAGQSDGTDNLSAIVAADRAFPAAVAELGR
jgi:hypothetical protein